MSVCSSVQHQLNAVVPRHLWFDRPSRGASRRPCDQAYWAPRIRGAPRSGGLCLLFLGFEIDHRGRQLGQRLVGCFLLVQRLLKQTCGIGHAELFSPCTKGAVARNFVVLDRLGGSDKPGIESRHSAKLLHDFRAFIGDAVDRLAGLSAGRLADDTENAVEAFDLTLGLPKVLVESCGLLFGLRSFRHPGQCLDDLVFGKVDVLEGLVEEITQLLLRPARATRRRFLLLRSFRHNFSWARLESACPPDQCCVTLKVPRDRSCWFAAPQPMPPYHRLVDAAP